VKSHLGGKIQQVMIADKEQFLALIGKAKAAEVTRGDGQPCTFKVGVEVRLENTSRLLTSSASCDRGSRWMLGSRKGLGRSHHHFAEKATGKVAF
jgi:hypothetical protein